MSSNMIGRVTTAITARAGDRPGRGEVELLNVMADDDGPVLVRQPGRVLALSLAPGPVAVDEYVVLHLAGQRLWVGGCTASNPDLNKARGGA